ncbi:hypothetical protein L861_00090 [Litchfieldella anticariensis FP35 = DSM 16096]|uniref:Integrase catalytic domain-containing protein n=1 Tax=Litchfieldella anticariensis (strain DSM 16096 / CECT 5854 / CIP 108499 / LMG 22089 / FP35) TaxID=1121939 RepID=S2LEN8_LITA3|nr:IS3 family transposase [Halomonas anticariensis]EPC01183.1 hypothetical protein L861_11450 [Halomonas anticariensis FP35 = DSM 16096]EPC01377.1 hypothetical protein L861_12450 [Halomonas anticariensis FP35 = DSM 16096]EPC02027.1 hypothetical protein L861_20455 [Halomonas anticariensis FP35 = DSM 16096]EPC03211.1 hypothetical protein L861_23160 [Halomonas anticariensis FP35 = DSM 16096]EPC04641.1 hypothetical protein L861_00090 [Halomonas anticariensis FP35 = DSM 16096]
MIINELRQSHALAYLLRAAGLARSVYYYWRKVLQRPDAYVSERQLIHRIFHAHKGRYGYRRMTLALRREGCHLNHKTVQKLMIQAGLKSTVRPKRYRSFRGDEGGLAANRLQRHFRADRPHQKWVTDITEFNIRGEKVFLSPVMDLYNREIVAFSIARTPRLPMVMAMLGKALQQVKDAEGLVLHSDQGWQYQMPAYHAALTARGAEVSMSRSGNCLDNAVIENFFGLLKSEFFHGQKFTGVERFIRELRAYIRYYNHDRIKANLKGLSPVEYRIQALGTATT